MYLAPAVAGVVARQLRAPGGLVTPVDDSALTPRERDVLGLVAEGLPNRAIGEASGSPSAPPGRTSRTSSPSWVLTSRTQAALYAVEQGLDGDGPRAPRHRS